MAGEERDRMAQRLRQVLIEIREAAGLTQTELAKALGGTQSFVSNYERGERKVDFVLIAQALKAEPRELLGRLI